MNQILFFEVIKWVFFSLSLLEVKILLLIFHELDSTIIKLR